MWTRRSFLTAATVSCAGGPALCAGATYVDLMPEFWRAYDAAQGQVDRPAALIQTFFTPNAEVYAGAGLKPTPPRVTKWLAAFDPMAPDVRRLTAQFPALYAGHVRHFAKAFPDFHREQAPIYLLPSLFSFDGHLQPWRGKLPLFIGLDGVARYHGVDADLSVFLDHEAFHLYQAQAHAQAEPGIGLDDPTPLYAAIWTEGVATYVSSRLNPRASLLHVLLDDKPVNEAPPQVVTAGARDILAHLDSTADEDQSRFLSAGYKGPSPPRLGYRIGFEVAKRAGARLSMAQMAALPRKPLRDLMERELKGLAA